MRFGKNGEFTVPFDIDVRSASEDADSMGQGPNDSRYPIGPGSYIGPGGPVGPGDPQKIVAKQKMKKFIKSALLIVGGISLLHFLLFRK